MSELIADSVKTNCHLHLTGSLPPDDLRAIGAASGVSTDEFEPLENHVVFEDPVLWAAAKEVTSQPVGLNNALRTVMSNERSDNVRYVEITFNPSGMLRRGMTSENIAQVAIDASLYGQTIGIDVRYKFGVNRKDGPGSIPDVVSVYQDCPEELRLGIDLNGDECRYPTADFVAPLGALAARDIPVYIHAGEHPESTESLRQALRAGPIRVAHAVAAAGSRTLLRDLAASGVAVEVAPTSNLQTKVVGSMLRHQLPDLLDSHIPVVLGSDDPAFFGSTMTGEWNSLLTMGFSEKEVLDQIVASNAIVNL
jgi:aminodeoxyfutalosine deaminase